MPAHPSELQHYAVPKPLLVLIGWTVVVVAVSYCSLTYGDTWDAARGPDGCRGDVGLSGTQTAAWLLGIIAAALLFAFLTNPWLVAGLGLINIPVSLITAALLALGSCGSPGSADVPFFAMLFASSTLAAGAVLAVPVLLFRGTLAWQRLRKAGRALPDFLPALALLLAAVVAVIALVSLVAVPFQGSDAFQSLISLCFYGGVIALLVWAWRKLKRQS